MCRVRATGSVGSRTRDVDACEAVIERIKARAFDDFIVIVDTCGDDLEDEREAKAVSI